VETSIPLPGCRTGAAVDEVEAEPLGVLDIDENVATNTCAWGLPQDGDDVTVS
jgi:hypothetical protein